MSLDHHDQQSEVENLKSRVLLWDQHGDCGGPIGSGPRYMICVTLFACCVSRAIEKKAKIEKISISRAILLEFLRSLVSTIRCEANKINLLREERPIG